MIHGKTCNQKFVGSRLRISRRRALPPLQSTIKLPSMKKEAAWRAGRSATSTTGLKSVCAFVPPRMGVQWRTKRGAFDRRKPTGQSRGSNPLAHRAARRR
jgi:hypothetical protein